VERIDFDFTMLEGIFSRPKELNDFAIERMEHVRLLLGPYEAYNCPPSCNECCYGSILMSYTEFTYILLFLQKRCPQFKIKELFRNRVGIMQDNGNLLCPFLQEKASSKHCSIYVARPLICRVFGTQASPCHQQAMRPSPLPESLFYEAYNLLYYCNDTFIALELDERWALFEAPFALWCLADNSKETRSYLSRLLQERKDTFNAVLYDSSENIFFAYRRGQRVLLST